MAISTAVQRSNLTLLATTASAPGSGATLQRFRCSAYRGEIIDRTFGKAIVDLQSLEVPTGKIPLLFRHGRSGWFQDIEQPRLGFCDSYKNTGRELIVEGAFTDTPESQRVIEEARQGYPWQASIGLDRVQQLLIPQGSSIQVNGREVEGPITVFRPSRLRELSILELGADATTDVELLRSQGVELLAPGSGGGGGSPVVATAETFRKALEALGFDWQRVGVAMQRLNGTTIAEAWARFPGALGLNPASDWANSPALRATFGGDRNRFMIAYGNSAATMSNGRPPLRPGQYLIEAARDFPTPAGHAAAAVLPLGSRRLSGLSGTNPEADWKKSAELRQWWERTGGNERSFLRYARSCMRAGDDYTIAHN